MSDKTNQQPIYHLPFSRLNALIARLSDAGLTVHDGEAILRLHRFQSAVARAVAEEWKRTPGVVVGPFEVKRDVLTAISRHMNGPYAREISFLTAVQSTMSQTARLAFVTAFELGLEEGKFSFREVVAAGQARGLGLCQPVEAVLAAYYAQADNWRAAMEPVAYYGQRWVFQRTMTNHITVDAMEGDEARFTEKNTFLFAVGNDEAE